MAVVDQENVIGSGTGSSFTLTSWTPASNDLVLVWVLMNDLTITPSLSGNGLTFVEVLNVTNTNSVARGWLFRAMKSNPSSGQITVTITGNTQNAAAIGVRFSGCDISGSDGSGAVESSASEAGPATANNDQLASVITVTNQALAVAFSLRQSTVFTVPGGETAILINQFSNQADCWKQGPVSPSASTQLGALNDLAANKNWSMALVSLKPMGGGFKTLLGAGR